MRFLNSVYFWIMIMLSYSQAESTPITVKELVSTRTWIPGWETDCTDGIVQTVLVPNIKTCEAYLRSCDGCYTAGFNVGTRECHLMKASPLPVISTSSTSRQHLCGEHRSVKATVECPELLLTNGKVSAPNEGPRHRNGESAVFTCDEGYNITGSGNLTCLDNMLWYGVPPSCPAVECPLLTLTLPAYLNGTSQNGSARFKYTETTNFYCDVGYFVNGNNTLTCLANASWDVSPNCSPVPCPLTPPDYGSDSAPSNGQQHTFGETATFTCDYGFELNGIATLTCLADGSWDGVPPTCSFLDIYPANDLTSCKATGSGEEYKGTRSVSKTRKQCLKWTDVKTEFSWLTARIHNIPESNLHDAVNYCRNFDNYAPGPWCYVTLAATWEVCAVPACPCQSPWIEFNGKCVVRYSKSTGVTWKAAVQFCEGKGARVITFQDMSRRHIAAFANRGCVNNYISLGGSKGSDSLWRFPDGTLIGNIPWDTNETASDNRLILALNGFVHDISYETQPHIGCIICVKSTS